MQAKGGDVMPHPTSPTVRAIQGRLCHAMPDVIRLGVLFKGGDVIPWPALLTVCAVQGR